MIGLVTSLFNIGRGISEKVTFSSLIHLSTTDGHDSAFSADLLNRANSETMPDHSTLSLTFPDHSQINMTARDMEKIYETFMTG